MNTFTKNLDRQPRPKPNVDPEYPKWMRPDPPDPDDHDKGCKLVRNAEEEEKWHREQGHFDPVEQDEIETPEPPKAVKPGRRAK